MKAYSKIQVLETI